MNTAIEERIRTRAYELWEAEGRPHGREIDHWLQAVQELAAEQDRSTVGVVTAARARKPRSVTATPAKRATAAKSTTTRSRSTKGAAPLS